MKAINEMKLTFESRSANEGFARVAVSAFVAQLDPTVEEISDIKTAVSEAVTNSIVHGYKDQIGRVYISARIYADSVVRLTIRDTGCGIEDVQKAVEPLYTTCETGERAGMGFAVMEAFTDKMRVRSTPGKGTTVYLEKRIRSKG
ncbi:anti-sigma F factor [Neobittarella massiliensis]|uniref:Anti-sigma F factor n=2 Tax=Oscillospiraceae TaxID=216572 RepID=A0A8J6LWG4_9FIRM|nr:anti-sigma F factor [Neobittarella massiliensis]MBC3517080.1 anti-sigma F factor [Neobittarella massiliensis]SCJ90088.1 Anti-sigma F factor [uncultured Anaerotruncus sp.]